MLATVMLPDMNPRYPFFAKHGKSLLAGAFAVYTVAVAQLSGDHHIDAVETTIIATAVLNAVLVYVVPMAPRWRWGKSAIGAGLAALAVLQTVLPGGVDLNEAYVVIGAIVAALGIPIAPAVSVAAGGGPSSDVVVHVGSDNA